MFLIVRTAKIQRGSRREVQEGPSADFAVLRCWIKKWTPAGLQVQNEKAMKSLGWMIHSGSRRTERLMDVLGQHLVNFTFSYEDQPSEKLSMRVTFDQRVTSPENHSESSSEEEKEEERKK
ncbi:hypothetical protein PROFUN_08591 [Planoprotostelium fungivorum]|uniref:Uncharacterized protein n=1 Tax=Planoprotostelium fungivorum TaxID=1890364 RepID=A0A2P6NJ75_9EUKA|nr:hypothetical protein PROFUN_08591 [Planoprotostelium fungivorum]